MQSPKSQLDPSRAFVGFRYDEIVAGEGCFGRVYFWYDPDRKLPTIDDNDFRTEHPELSDTQWEQLFCEAFERGETDFHETLTAKAPALWSPLTGQQVLSLVRLFAATPAQVGKIVESGGGERTRTDPEQPPRKPRK